MTAFSTFPPAPVPGSETFESDAGVVLDHMPTFVSEANAFAADIQATAEATTASQVAAAARAATAGTSAATATSAAATATAAANYKGSWSALTGALNIPASVLHNGQLWLLTSSLANVTTATPGVSSAWYPLVNLDIADRAPIQPSLDLDFARQRYRVLDGAVGLRQIALSDILTYTGSGRTYTGARGTLVAQASNVPRITFDPVTGAGLGLSAWGARTNLLLNSLVDGTPLATQSVTLSAGDHRLSFYGTGTVTLSAGATGTLTGSGAYPTRSGLTFTATAGRVTFTVSGSVQFAQLTTGTEDSPFIPTAGSAVTSPADVPSITGSNFSKWFNPIEGTMVVIARNLEVPPSNRFIWALSDGTSANYLSRRVLSSGSMNYLCKGSPLNTVYEAPATGITTSSAAAWSPSGFAHSPNGAPVVNTAYTGLPPDINQLQLGGSVGATLISRILYFPRALPSNLQALSA